MLATAGLADGLLHRADHNQQRNVLFAVLFCERLRVEGAA
jgi:hypothetical protein